MVEHDGDDRGVGDVDQDALVGQHQAAGGCAQAGVERQVAGGDRLDREAQRQCGAIEDLGGLGALGEAEMALDRVSTPVTW